MQGASPCGKVAWHFTVLFLLSSAVCLAPAGADGNQTCGDADRGVACGEELAGLDISLLQLPGEIVSDRGPHKTDLAADVLVDERGSISSDSGEGTGERALTLFRGPVWQEVITWALLALCSACVSATGVGGGGLYAPLLMLVLHMESSMAIVASLAMQLAASLVASLYSGAAEHPSRPSRPQIDCSLALLCGTGMTVGARLGSAFRTFMPAKTLFIILCMTLARAGGGAVRMAWLLTKKEAAADAINAPALKAWDTKDKASAETEDLQAMEERFANAMAGFALLAVWVLDMGFVAATAIMTTDCSFTWWVSLAMSIAVLSLCGVLLASHLRSQEPADKDDLDFRQLSLKLLWTSVLGGMLVAFSGSSGWMATILVEMHVPPIVAASTMNVATVMMVSSSLLIFFINADAFADYLLFLIAIAALGALLGQVLISQWVSKRGTQSVLVWSSAILIVLSLISGVYMLVTKVVLEPVGMPSFKYCITS